MDHFEPETTLDPQAQRRLRGQLEQIDFTAYASNLEVLSRTVRYADADRFQHLAVAAANARAQWVSEALAASEASAALSVAQIERLGQLRTAYEEITAVYEAMRRMVERGYLPYRAAAV